MKTSLNLFRSIRIEQFPLGTIIDSQPAPAILYPDFEDRELPDGGIRRADVEVTRDSNGVHWVLAGKGTSLFDKANAFKGKNGCLLPFQRGRVCLTP